MTTAAAAAAVLVVGARVCPSHRLFSLQGRVVEVGAERCELGLEKLEKFRGRHVDQAGGVRVVQTRVAEHETDLGGKRGCVLRGVRDRGTNMYEAIQSQVRVRTASSGAYLCPPTVTLQS